MIRKAMIAGLALLMAVPAMADTVVTSQREVRIPRMSRYLEWVADGQRGVWIRGDTGKWYYARTQGKCARLRPAVALGFQTSRGELDRFSSLKVEGWRCPLASVVESTPPPGHRSAGHH